MFVCRSGSGNTYLTDGAFLTDDVLLRYVNHYLEEFVLQNIKNETGTTKGYTRVVNEYYKKWRFPLSCTGFRRQEVIMAKK